MEIIKPVSNQPMPPNASLVYKGQIFDTYQWEQEMYDGTTKVFEKLKRPDTVVVFPVLENGNILLTRQSQPGKDEFIGACGGRVDEGEDVFSAAKREFMEETGYEAKEICFWKSIQPVSKIDWAVYIFIAKGCKKVAEQCLDGGEKIESFEVSFDEFLQIARQDKFSEQEVVRDVYEALIDSDKYQELKQKFTK